MSATPASRTLVPEILPLSQPAPRLRKQSDFVEFIWRRWLDSIEAFLEVGNALIDAKTAFGHGAFLEMVKEQLPFGEDKAQRLMAIAKNPVLANADVRRRLPAAWTTLYELSRVPLPRLQAALEAGEITPDLAEHQARALWREDAGRERAQEFEIFLCPGCGAEKLLPDESRPSALGEQDHERPRLYRCEGCGKAVLTFERVEGLYAKGSLPKSSRAVRS